MSGSGSSGDLDRNPGTGHGVDCSKFAYETHISSPQQAGLAIINEGDVLEVVLSSDSGVEVLQLLKSSQVIGGIVKNAYQLKQCIKSGFEFEALVRGINGAAVEIFIRPKRS